MEKTATQNYLDLLPDSTKQKFAPVFGDIAKFYITVYLIARNEHIIGNDKPDRHEDKLDVIHNVQNRIEAFLNQNDLPGKDIMADIASDYFEDYVHYREPEIDMSNEEFLDIIRKVSQLK